MTSNWLSLWLLDKKLTVEEYEDIPNARLELHTHVLVKNIQMGLILGMGLVGPLVGLKRGRSATAAWGGGVRGGKVGMGILSPLAPLMTEGTVRNQEYERIYDRAFRIRYNSGQMRADRWAVAGGVGGLVMGGVVARVGALAGGMLGVIVGTLSAGVHTNIILK